MQKNVNFQTCAHAKCILAGEHTVLRGYPAIVLPITNKMIMLAYQHSNHPIETDCRSLYEDTFLLFFWKTLQQGLKLLKKNINEVHGKFIIENTIPMGAGIGFSSALCVVLTRWFIWEHWLKEKKLFYFANHLEDIFHGKSSGLDIAGAMADHAVHFEKSGDIHEIQTRWQPKLYLSYSGQTKNTAKAIDHVNELRKKHPKLAKTIDEEMATSVVMIEKALQSNASSGLYLLAEAIEHANHCFEEWELITLELQQHIDQLHQLGAIAAKPTGAGEGGYVLSLWQDAPPQESSIEFIPVFEELP